MIYYDIGGSPELGYAVYKNGVQCTAKKYKTSSDAILAMYALKADIPLEKIENAVPDMIKGETNETN